MTQGRSGRAQRTRSAAVWPGRRSITIAVGALVVATVVWWLTAHDASEAHGLRASSHAAVAASAPIATSAGRIAPLPAPPVTPYPEGGAAGVTRDDPVTAYRRANVYPPTSRPLTTEQVDLLHPNQRHEVMRPTEHGLGLEYLFTADRYFVIGDETLTATLEVRHNGKPISVKVTQAFATVLDPVGHDEHPVALTFSSTGTMLASTFAPARLGAKRQAAISVSIEFDHGSGVQRGHLDFQYTPTSGIPARFTGAFTEALDAGSLVIRAGVDVAVAGHYVIDANLYDAADQPVAWSRYKGELASGSQDAALVFFGKVIVDAKAHGPFHLGQLRGARYAPGEDPDLEQLPSYAGSYVTRAYPTDAFSDAEYDSAEKRRMLELLGNDSSHRGGAGRAPGAP